MSTSASTPSSRVAKAKQVVDHTNTRLVDGTLNVAVSTTRKLHRLGWKVEKRLDQGVKVLRRHPNTTVAVTIGLVAAISILVAYRRKR